MGAGQLDKAKFEAVTMSTKSPPPSAWPRHWDWRSVPRSPRMTMLRPFAIRKLVRIQTGLAAPPRSAIATTTLAPRPLVQEANLPGSRRTLAAAVAQKATITPMTMDFIVICGVI